MTSSPQAPVFEKQALFETYLAALKGRKVACDDQSVIHNRLRLAGIVKRRGSDLQVRNRDLSASV